MKPEPWIMTHAFWILGCCTLLLFLGGINKGDDFLIIFSGFLTLFCFTMGIFYVRLDSWLTKNKANVDKYAKAVYHQKKRKNFRIIKGDKK